jgi:hypothetical protein
VGAEHIEHKKKPTTTGEFESKFNCNNNSTG